MGFSARNMPSTNSTNQARRRHSYASSRGKVIRKGSFSPAEVLGWVTNKLRTPEQLHRIFYAMRFLRRLNRLGYVHFRRWKLYGEEGLARQPAVIWLHGDALTVEHEETPLAQYTVRYQPDHKHFKDVPETKRFETPYRSPQSQLWELDDSLWHLAKRLPEYAPRKRRKKSTALQLHLVEDM
jgi:putative transposase